MKKYPAEKMCCPFCGEKLYKGKQRKFETLADHVFDPNWEQEKPLRDTYECFCGKSKGCFWDELGDFYSNESHFGEVNSALNSAQRSIDNKFARERKMRKTFIGRLCLKVYGRYNSVKLFVLCKIHGYKFP